MTETRFRSVAKAISWRIIASIITGLIVFLLTDSKIFAVEAGLADSLIKIFAYYLHERAWGRFNIGMAHHPLADLKFRDGIGEEEKKIIRKKLEELGYVHTA